MPAPWMSSSGAVLAAVARAWYASTHSRSRGSSPRSSPCLSAARHAEPGTSAMSAPLVPDAATWRARPAMAKRHAHRMSSLSRPADASIATMRSTTRCSSSRCRTASCSGSVPSTNTPNSTSALVCSATSSGWPTGCSGGLMAPGARSTRSAIEAHGSGSTRGKRRIAASTAGRVRRLRYACIMLLSSVSGMRQSIAASCIGRSSA
mmetsp:Transcript_11891/g.35092  ORF Transcript_11891/g.35092 Transcript_11891/m.35092 type:complete len:206 (+) Transcript_11891:588-1205(+)